MVLSLNLPFLLSLCQNRRKVTADLLVKTNISCLILFYYRTVNNNIFKGSRFILVQLIIIYSEDEILVVARVMFVIAGDKKGGL